MQCADDPPLMGATGEFILDVGGEGRHPNAWNLNPRRSQSFGESRGQPIPRLIQARAEAIPLPDASVDLVLAERTPLRVTALAELRRVIRPTGRIILRHVVTPAGDPHRFAIRMLGTLVERRTATIGAHEVQESILRPVLCLAD